MTFNSVYVTARTGRRFMSKEGKEYKASIQLVACNHFADLRGCEDALKFTMIVRGPWLTNKGKISRTAGDLDGFVKLCQDSICESIGVNDCVIVELHCRKEYAVKWSFSVNLERTWDLVPAKSTDP